jgi:hypothetical protein
MITIQLTQGYETVIDDFNEDLTKYSWHYSQGYAVRKRHVGESGYPGSIGLHRVVLERKLGRPLRKGLITDHIDRNKLRNLVENLREATHSLSRLNTHRNSESGYEGVTRQGYEGYGWRARIRIDGKQVSLGTFRTKEEAYEAYKKKSEELNR